MFWSSLGLRFYLLKNAFLGFFIDSFNVKKDAFVIFFSKYNEILRFFIFH